MGTWMAAGRGRLLVGGGPLRLGNVVDVDEIKLMKRKYHVGYLPAAWQHGWCVHMVERGRPEVSVVWRSGLCGRWSRPCLGYHTSPEN